MVEGMGLFLGGMSGQELFYPVQLFFREGRAVQRLYVFGDLSYGAGADDDRGNALVAKNPRQCHLSQRLSPLAGYPVELPGRLYLFGGNLLPVEEDRCSCRARVRGDAVQVFVCQQTLCQRRESYEARPVGGCQREVFFPC